MFRLIDQMLIHAIYTEICFSRAITAFVSPADDVLRVTQLARYAFVQGLAWLRDNQLLKRVQSKDKDGGHEYEGLELSIGRWLREALLRDVFYLNVKSLNHKSY
jgi:hypothetical protein